MKLEMECALTLSKCGQRSTKPSTVLLIAGSIRRYHDYTRLPDGICNVLQEFQARTVCPMNVVKSENSRRTRCEGDDCLPERLEETSLIEMFCSDRRASRRRDAFE